MRLIDADALRDEIAVLFERNPNLIDGWLAYAVEDTIDDAPTIDAVEVVRCKDCMMLQCCRFAQGLGLDGFCSQGERKNETD